MQHIVYPYPICIVDGLEWRKIPNKDNFHSNWSKNIKKCMSKWHRFIVITWLLCVWHRHHGGQSRCFEIYIGCYSYMGCMCRRDNAPKLWCLKVNVFMYFFCIMTDIWFGVLFPASYKTSIFHFVPQKHYWKSSGKCIAVSCHADTMILFSVTTWFSHNIQCYCESLQHLFTYVGLSMCVCVSTLHGLTWFPFE